MAKELKKKEPVTFHVLEDKKGHLLIDLSVQPGGSKNEILGWHQKRLKIKLTAPPVQGLANEKCRTLLAKTLHIPKSSIQILFGHSSRRKRIAIRGITKQDLIKALDDLVKI